MDERFQQLRQRAERSFGNRPISETVGMVRAIVGPIRFAQEGSSEDELVNLADQALVRLRNLEEPTPREHQALLVLIQLTRPSILSRNGRLGPLPEHRTDPAFKQTWEKFSDRAQPLLYSVGRIDGPLGRRRYGTGFVVNAGVLLTNKHVLHEVASGAEKIEKGQAIVNFRQEWDCIDEEDPVPVISVLKIHPKLDMVLLEIPKTPARPALPVAAKEPETGRVVVALGYPDKDLKNSPAMMERIYEDRYGVKRASPGEVIDQRDSHFYHDCSTLGGNSGSPMFDMETGEVVGLHRSGYFMWRNQAIAGTAVVDFLG